MMDLDVRKLQCRDPLACKLRKCPVAIDAVHLAPEMAKNGSLVARPRTNLQHSVGLLHFKVLHDTRDERRRQNRLAAFDRQRRILIGQPMVYGREKEAPRNTLDSRQNRPVPYPASAQRQDQLGARLCLVLIDDHRLV